MKNKKGFAPIIIIAIVAVAAAGVVGYSLLNKNKTGGTSIIPKVELPKVGSLALNANCKYNDPDLCKAFNRTMEGDLFKGSFSGKSVVTSKEGKKTESEFKFEKEGNSQFISYENGKETFNMINLGDATYTKDFTDGKWLKYSIPKTTQDKQKNNLFNTEEMKNKMKEDLNKEDKAAYKKIGKERCDQFLCFKYQVIDTNNPDALQYLYFDDREYLMRKMRTEAKNGEINDFSFNYDPVTIKEPSPIKESSTGGWLGGGETTKNDKTPSKEEIEKMKEEFKNLQNKISQSPTKEESE